VVTGGLQQVTPRMQIRPDRVPMPTLGPQESPAAASDKATK
jgi:hypothetical protein